MISGFTLSSSVTRGGPLKRLGPPIRKALPVQPATYLCQPHLSCARGPPRSRSLRLKPNAASRGDELWCLPISLGAASQRMRGPLGPANAARRNEMRGQSLHLKRIKCGSDSDSRRTVVRLFPFEP
jgi:hypothetical protein